MVKKTTSTPIQPDVTSYRATATSGAVVTSRIDEILHQYSQPATRVLVEVLRSHDQLYEGQVVELPNDERTAGLITGGFLQLVPPTILGVDFSQ